MGEDGTGPTAREGCPLEEKSVNAFPHELTLIVKRSNLPA